MESGQAEVLEELPWPGVKFFDDPSRRDRHRFGTVKPFAASYPRNNQRKLKRASQHIGDLQNRLVQAKQKTSGNTASRSGSEKRIHRDHSADRECQREPRGRGALRELPPNRQYNAAFPPGRFSGRCKGDLGHAGVGLGEKINTDRGGDKRARQRKPARVAARKDRDELSGFFDAKEFSEHVDRHGEIAE